MGATEAQFGAAERQGGSDAFLAGRMPQVVPAAPEAEKAVRFLCRCWKELTG